MKQKVEPNQQSSNYNRNAGEVFFESEAINYDPNCVMKKMEKDVELQKEFADIFGPYKIKTEIVHGTKGQAESNADFDTFYRYFLAKHICTLQGKDVRNILPEKYASIFPFKTDVRLGTKNVPMADLLTRNGTFCGRIEKFLIKHFGVADHLHRIVLLLANVNFFKRVHVPGGLTYAQLRKKVSYGLEIMDWTRGPLHVAHHLTRFPRLSDKGIHWYKHFQIAYNHVADLFKYEKKLPMKQNPHYRYLLEINCCELLMLLEREFYDDRPEDYVRLFKKYLFFFVHAISASEHPIFFIDEPLWRCLKSLRKYLTSRLPVVALKWEVWMMTLVHRRQHRLCHDRKKRFFSRVLYEKNFNNAIAYVEKLPNLQSAAVYYEEPEYQLRFRIYLLGNDVAYLMGYSNNRKLELKSFYGLILKCALLSKKIRKIVYYDAYQGTEFSIQMSPNINGIRDFIRRHSHAQPLYPEHFLIRDMVEYFESVVDTASD